MDEPIVTMGPFSESNAEPAELPEAEEAFAGSRKRLREPTTKFWMVLKVIFLLLNSASIATIILLINSTVSLGQIASGKEFEGIAPTDLQIKTARLLIMVTIPMIVLGILQTIIGFIGLYKIHLTSLYVYTAFVAISLIMQIIALAFKFDSAIGLFYSDICLLVLMYLMIKEIKLTNQIS